MITAKTSSSDPLFSSIITLFILILLYFPHLPLRVVFSPVPILTGTLLLTLLRLGAIKREGENKNRELNSIESEEEREWVVLESEKEYVPETGSDSFPCFENSFVEWNVRAPLEVIYEAYEGEEHENPNMEETQMRISLHDPESDSDTSSEDGFFAIGDWDSPENMFFRWEEEDREGLIEIALDGNNSKKSNLDFHGEEENLIEIDISPARNGDFPVRVTVS